MKLAIFDIDGTLTDSHGYDRYFFARLAEHAGASGLDGDLTGWTDVTDEGIAYDVLRAHGRTPTAADIERIKADYEADLRELGWNFLGLNADRAKLLDVGATHVLGDFTDLEAVHAALAAAGVPG
jgi:beta-phosphoglucomutase-like phosphatase (HAD superfamily)